MHCDSDLLIFEIFRKYEEICAPQVEEFWYITDINTHGLEEVLEMERRVLNELKFDLTSPTTKSFWGKLLSLGLAHAQPPKFRSLDYGAVWSLSTCSLQAFHSRAARAGYKVPTLNLEFLGDFHAELTLLEYGYLPFLPSMIAASAVYMAKLTLDLSTCPWVCSSARDVSGHSRSRS